MKKKIISLVMALAIILSVVLIAPVTVSAANWETEDNNEYATADRIAENGTLTANLLTGEDVDYFKFTPSANGVFSLNFKHKVYDSNCGWNINIYGYLDGNYSLLCSKEISLSSNESINFPNIGVRKGISYYIRVSQGSWWLAYTEKNYILYAGFKATEYYEKENNNDYDSANVLTINKSYQADLAKGDDVDFFKVVPDADGKLRLNFKHKYQDSNCGWNINIYGYLDGNYSLLCSKEISLSSNESINFPIIGVRKGISYYIRVSQGSWWLAYTDLDYTVSTSLTKTSLYEKENNGSYDSANTISLSLIYGGNLLTTDDCDVYKFTIEKNKYTTIKFVSSADSEYNIKVNKYTGTEYALIKQIATESSQANKEYNIVTLNTPGTYYITITYSGRWSAPLNNEPYSIQAWIPPTLKKVNGKWYYVANGVVGYKATTLCKYSGTWYYVNNGIVDFNANTLVKYSGAWYHVKNGIFTSKEGATLVKYGSTWYYCNKGVLNKSNTMVKYGGKWYHVNGGTYNPKEGATLCKYSGTWYYCYKGVLDNKSNTMVKYGGKWYHVKGGTYNPKESATLCKYGGIWYYCNKGVLDNKSNTLVKYSGTWYHVKGGTYNPKEGATLVKYGGKWYYCKGGKVNFNYTGNVKYGGKTYKVVKGIKK